LSHSIVLRKSLIASAFGRSSFIAGFAMASLRDKKSFAVKTA
jgi:hypothetical protein